MFLNFRIWLIKKLIRTHPFMANVVVYEGRVSNSVATYGVTECVNDPSIEGVTIEPVKYPSDLQADIVLGI